MLPDTIPVVDAVPIDGNQGHGVPVVNIWAEDILLPDGGGDEPETGQPKAKKRRQRRPKEPEGGLGATSAMMASGATSGRHVTLGQLPLEIEALLMGALVGRVQAATGVLRCGRHTGDRSACAKGYVEQVGAVEKHMREHFIAKEVQLPKMVDNCQQLVRLAMGAAAVACRTARRRGRRRGLDGGGGVAAGLVSEMGVPRLM